MTGSFTAGMRLKAQFGANIGNWVTVSSATSSVSLDVPAGSPNLVIHYDTFESNDAIHLDKVELFDCL